MYLGLSALLQQRPRHRRPFDAGSTAFLAVPVVCDTLSPASARGVNALLRGSGVVGDRRLSVCKCLSGLASLAGSGAHAGGRAVVCFSDVGGRTGTRALWTLCPLHRATLSPAEVAKGSAPTVDRLGTGHSDRPGRDRTLEGASEPSSTYSPPQTSRRHSDTSGAIYSNHAARPHGARPHGV